MKINITKTQRAKLVKDWLNDMFSDADLINSYYVKNGKKLAYQNKKIKGVWFDYNTIWSFLEDAFSLEYEEVVYITKDWVEETLNLKGYTTHHINFTLFLPR